MKKLHVVGLASYKPEQWSRLLEFSADRETLEPTYDEWKANTDKKIEELREQSVFLDPVEVDIDELVAWCKAGGRPVDKPARAAYVAAKLRDRNRGVDT